MRRLALVSFTAAGEKGLSILRAKNQAEIESLVDAWLPKGVSATRVEVRWVKWSPTALVGEFWWEGPEQTMRKPQMEAFERVLQMAKSRGIPPGWEEPTPEDKLADAEAIERVAKWIDRQKKARGWDKPNA